MGSLRLPGAPQVFRILIHSFSARWSLPPLPCSPPGPATALIPLRLGVAGSPPLPHRVSAALLSRRGPPCLVARGLSELRSCSQYLAYGAAALSLSTRPFIRPARGPKASHQLRRSLPQRWAELRGPVVSVAAFDLQLTTELHGGAPTPPPSWPHPPG
ncbi:hypothetical protein NDU88_001357 [Pleurodeles waltl]|uniref:Uncharacterized protein n=1 Tax=Pleurodeles waltl TaxID=8319 RepID=A0AAV7UV39_PLEWA|nr:hypothetical protein NDU88_001357 [Pleurodeles waltl]